ncbi:tRNA dihydrouridine synthase DusB [Aureliella helgolandensis]|uniref:tRNA-dihydrouridine synthase n=1 Tax=Aureliella helgolandensis TaxID=2527968 RepID=A0A518G0K6_9BACT|nr:tRNA dihydrouridine synthase DusB [Aureliella helgolandensis]QDV22106.1 putative tRNA-dihydrouridine synthase [Aureliella helgolandensis]
MVNRSTLNISRESSPVRSDLERAAAEAESVTQPLVVPPLRIGPLVIDPPILQAPMAGFTNYAYRQVVREYGGVGLQATEMVNARGFVWLDEHEAEHPDRLWGVREEARPLAVQIWDNDPETMAKVGRRLAEEYQVSVVDINFGCPVKQVTQRAHSGSYLLRDPQRMHEIISQLVRACAPTPVTAKIRLGCTRKSANAKEIAKVVEEAGASALTVHGRTAEDYFKGSADWEQIAEIKQHLVHIPLIGNGDLDSAEKVVFAFRNYQVDGVMIARAALGRPWLFAQSAAALRGEPIPPEPTLAEQKECMLRHFKLVVERFGVQQGTHLMRKFACCYAQGRRGARMFRTKVAHVESPEAFYEAVETAFPTDDEPPKQESNAVEPGASS